MSNDPGEVEQTKTVSTILDELVEKHGGPNSALLRRIIAIEQLFLADRGKQAQAQVEALLIEQARLSIQDGESL